MKTLTLLTLLVTTTASANFSTYTACFNRMYRDSMMSFGFKKGGIEQLYLRDNPINWDFARLREELGVPSVNTAAFELPLSSLNCSGSLMSNMYCTGENVKLRLKLDGPNGLDQFFNVSKISFSSLRTYAQLKVGASIEFYRQEGENRRPLILTWNTFYVLAGNRNPASRCETLEQY